MTCILSFVFGEGFGYPKKCYAVIKYWDVFEIYFTQTFQDLIPKLLMGSLIYDIDHHFKVIDIFNKLQCITKTCLVVSFISDNDLYFKGLDSHLDFCLFMMITNNSSIIKNITIQIIKFIIQC